MYSVGCVSTNGQWAYLPPGDQSAYVTLQAERQRLPIYSARKKLLLQLQSLTSSIVIGETASGKTTQIPQVGESENKMVRL